MIDATPPTLTVAASPSSLWSPNHKYVSIDISIDASDVCDNSPIVTAVVQSNEPDNTTGKGDGNTTGDIRVTTAQGDVRLSSNDAPQVVFDPLNDNIELRAERAGGGTGRTYTIDVTVIDVSGNEAMVTLTVTVPHDQGK